MPKDKYTRPKDWEKTIRRSYDDPEKDYTGKKYSDYEEVNEEEERQKKAEKAGESKYFGKLLKKIIGG